MMPGPVVVGGVGGSGTRVVAQILLDLRFDLGNDLNDELDDRWFNLLFYRPAWVQRAATGMADDVPIALDLMYKRGLGGRRLNADELAFLYRAWRDVVADQHFGGRGGGRRARTSSMWTARRVAQFLRAGRVARDAGAARWGWKEPLSHVFARHVIEHDHEARYIHVVRHGLDMAFSPNRRQVRRFAPLFGMDALQQRPSPGEMLRYWVRANRVIIDELRPAAPERVHVVNFDDLCRSPGPEIERLVEFLVIDIAGQAVQRLSDIPKPPESMGRRRSHDLTALDAADVIEVERLGFSA